MSRFGTERKSAPAPLPVAVVDPTPVYRRGLEMTLAEAGFAPQEPDDLRSWASARDAGAVLITLRREGDWDRFKLLKTIKRGTVVLVVLLTDAAPSVYAEALQDGAEGAVAWDETPEAIVQVLNAAVEGKALLPLDVARFLASRTTTLRPPKSITPKEIEWLRILAAGATVQELAEKIGYTERALYRLLRDLYSRMGVSNRTEAILKASRWDLRDPAYGRDVPDGRSGTAPPDLGETS